MFCSDCISPHYQQHLNPVNPSFASSCSLLSPFISIFIHFSRMYTPFLLTPHLHLPRCRAPGDQRPTSHDGLAPTAEMTNSPCRAKGCRVELQRWLLCWVGFTPFSHWGGCEMNVYTARQEFLRAPIFQTQKRDSVFQSSNLSWIIFLRRLSLLPILKCAGQCSF